VLPRLCKISPLSRDWLDFRREADVDLPPSLKTYLWNFQLAAMIKCKKSTLSRIVLPHARHPTSRLDQAVYIKDHQERAMALRWHRNFAFVRSRCCVDPSHLSNRGFLARCGFEARLVAALNIRPSVKKRQLDELAALREEVEFESIITQESSFLSAFGNVQVNRTRSIRAPHVPCAKAIPIFGTASACPFSTIFTHAGNSNLEMLRAMLFLPNCVERFKWLRASFCLHIRKLKESSPFKILQVKHGFAPWSAAFLLQRLCCETDLFKEWDTANTESDQQVTLKFYLKNRLLKSYAQSDKTLIRCILPSVRHPLSRQDWAVYFHDHAARSAALRWRRNLAFVRSQCPSLTGHTLNRRCLEGCGLQQHMVTAIGLPTRFLERWFTEREELIGDGFTGIYTLLDSLLNHKNSLDWFHDAFKHLAQLINPQEDANAEELIFSVLGSQPATA
jgi:hypothetical protein